MRLTFIQLWLGGGPDNTGAGPMPVDMANLALFVVQVAIDLAFAR
jgi:hypothetical protein